MNKLTLILSILLAFQLWAEDLLSMHKLAVDAFYVKDISQNLPTEHKDYDCGLVTEYESYDEIRQTSKKRFLYSGQGTLDRNLTGLKEFYCGFDNKSEALKAKDTILLNCINAGYINCNVAGTGEKNGGYIMLGGNEIKADSLMAQRDIALEQQDIREKRRLEIANYIASKRELCVAYGYEGVNVIAECVEREINKDTLRQNQAAQNNYQIQQRNNQKRSEALAEMGKTLMQIGSGQTKTAICNFKSFSGTIITGDCRQTAIKQNGETYWKI